MKRLALSFGLILVLMSGPAFGQKVPVKKPPTMPFPLVKEGRAALLNADGLTSLQLAFRGTFWRDPDLVADLGLTSDQTKKMEEIFRQYRLKLIDISAALEKDELLLTPMIDALPAGDNAKLAAQIDKIANDRAELEKTNS